MIASLRESKGTKRVVEAAINFNNTAAAAPEFAPVLMQRIFPRILSAIEHDHTFQYAPVTSPEDRDRYYQWASAERAIPCEKLKIFAHEEPCPRSI